MKNKPGKAPAFQMYPSDLLNDVELKAASWQTKGIWVWVFMNMWNARIRGELSGTVTQLSKIIGCTEAEFEAFFEEAQALLFCNALRSDNGKITLRNRRMFREAKYREKAKEDSRLRQQRYREKQASNADVTRRHNDTSTSTSISTSTSTSNIKKKNKQKKKVQLKIPDWLDKETWKNYQEHRKEIKSPMTLRAEELAIQKLKNYMDNGYDPVDIVNQSIEMGWKGLFEPKNFSKSGVPISDTQAFNTQSALKAMEIIGDDEE